MTAAASPFPAGADVAEALAERLGTLAESMLIAVDDNDGNALLELLREQEEVRGRLEPRTASLRAEWDRLREAGDPDADSLAGALARLGAILERVLRANQVLEEQTARACASLEAQLATHRQRSGAVLSYGVNYETSGSAFSRIG